ncbi:MAG: hypothetical protein GY804_05655 [Alphaproteobacteria bacterium]|nr:hypothetical protein [Alphaproteobacteria bacterium]
MNSTMPEIDQMRSDITDQYNATLSELEEEFSTDPTGLDERKMRLLAMIESTIELRKQYNSYVEEQLETPEILDEVTNYLSAEYLPLEKIDVSEMDKAFTEYFLYSMTEGSSLNGEINVDYLKDVFAKALPVMEPSAREKLMGIKHLFEWGKLVA